MQLLKQFRLFLMLLLSSSFIFLSACSSDGGTRDEYMDANSGEALEIPPRLNIPDTSGALQLPEPAKKTKGADCN
jgi:uncharacterized lipoprotein